MNSLYDFSTFKNSQLAESIVYTPANGTPVTIQAVVFRKPISTESKRYTMSDIPFHFYPLVVEIDRNDLATVTVTEDAIECNDADGNSKSFRVRAILTSDPGCWKLGL